MSQRSRPYVSSVRRKSAEETRSKIAEAARTLFAKHGLEETTIDAIAEAAGVAAQTVYATFGSKKGIAAELLDRARFGPDYFSQIERVRSAEDPASRLRFVAGIARRIYDAERSEIDLLRAASAMSAAVDGMERERECKRYEAQAIPIEIMIEEKSLKKGLTATTARDMLWTLTGRETYRMLKVERGWSSEAYEEWIGALLVASLVKDELLTTKPKSKARVAPKRSKSRPED